MEQAGKLLGSSLATVIQSEQEAESQPVSQRGWVSLGAHCHFSLLLNTDSQHQFWVVVWTAMNTGFARIGGPRQCTGCVPLRQKGRVKVNGVLLGASYKQLTPQQSHRIREATPLEETELAGRREQE